MIAESRYRRPTRQESDSPPATGGDLSGADAASPTESCATDALVWDAAGRGGGEAAAERVMRRDASASSLDPATSPTRSPPARAGEARVSRLAPPPSAPSSWARARLTSRLMDDVRFRGRGSSPGPPVPPTPSTPAGPAAAAPGPSENEIFLRRAIEIGLGSGARTSGASARSAAVGEDPWSPTTAAASSSVKDTDFRRRFGDGSMAQDHSGQWPPSVFPSPPR